MTFSICATDDGSHGLAIASQAVAVGSTASHVGRGGAVCTQATTSTPLGVRTLRAFGEGTAADAAIDTQVSGDERAAVRQLHGVDQDGTAGAHTGSDCVDWAGHRIGTGVTVAGNMLEGPAVLDSMVDAYEAAEGRPIDVRLLRALRAGEDAGGDSRGPAARSSALAVFDPDSPRLHHDLRVDEHDDAVSELQRVREVVAADGETLVQEYPGFDPRRHPE